MTGQHSAWKPGTTTRDSAVVRAALERILGSARFQCCEPQARLLRTAVEKHLAGREFRVKDGPAAELRARLAEYYAAEGAGDAVRMELAADGLRAVAAAGPRKHGWQWAVTAALGLAILLWAGSWWHARRASAQVRSLAVLPFGGAPPEGREWLAAGLTGEVLSDLQRVPGLRLTGRDSVFRVPGDTGKELGVEAVVKAHVLAQAGGIHVTLEMDRVADGYRLWKTGFDRPAGALPALAEEIAAAMARRLQLPVPAAERHRAPEQAYERYVEGRWFLDQGTPEALNRAAGRLEEATRLDPEFARAWAWLAIAREYRVAAGMARPNQAMPASRDAAERAVALEGDSGDAHLALGIVKLQYDWDWAGAKDELERAVSALPGSACARGWMARWYLSQGRVEEAIGETERALALDPLSQALLGDAAREYLALGKPDGALPFAQKAADLRPDDARARALLASVLWSAGQTEKSRRVVEQLKGSTAHLPGGVLPSLEARLGDRESARELLDQAEDLPDDQLMPAVDYAELAGALEDWDRLFSWTQEAYGERDVEMPYWLESPVIPKSDPRYGAFLVEMNLADQGRRP